MAIQDLYNCTFNLYSYEETGRNDLGGIEKTAVFKSSQRGYYTYLRGGEQYKFGKNNVIAKYRLFCDELNIKSTDIVQIQNLWFNIKSIDPCSNFAHHYEITLRAVSTQDIIQETGWTWGEQFPIKELPEVWTTWKYKESNVMADNDGIWGRLLVTGTKQFVSPVKDVGWIGTKYIELSYDDYAHGSSNSGKKICWRGSNVLFAQDSNEIVGPVWTLYSNTVLTDFRYLQVKASIY